MTNQSIGAAKLRRFLERNRISVRRVATQLGLHHVSVLDWLRGHKRPSIENRDRVRDLTEGRVRPSDWDKARDARTEAA